MKPDIRGIEQTIKRIIDEHCSVSSYGDGELDITVGRNIDFQTYDPQLAQKMKDILQLSDENYTVCLHNSFLMIQRS